MTVDSLDSFKLSAIQFTDQTFIMFCVQNVSDPALESSPGTLTIPPSSYSSLGTWSSIGLCVESGQCSISP